MPQREITLDTAAFLDSTQAQALAGVKREDAQKVCDRFLACCYDEVGKAPRHLDGDDLHGIVGHLLPGHFGRRDPLAAHVPAVLRAYLEFLGERATISQMFELRRALEGTLDEFAHAVETGEHAHHAHHQAPQQKPFVHRAEKTGRNDPCPCGSGKKFKQCHGKA
jgi:hypothetical protein